PRGARRIPEPAAAGSCWQVTVTPGGILWPRKRALPNRTKAKATARRRASTTRRSRISPVRAKSRRRRKRRARLSTAPRRTSCATPSWWASATPPRRTPKSNASADAGWDKLFLTLASWPAEGQLVWTPCASNSGARRFLPNPGYLRRSAGVEAANHRLTEHYPDHLTLRHGALSTCGRAGRDMDKCRLVGAPTDIEHASRASAVKLLDRRVWSRHMGASLALAHWRG